MFIPIGIPLEPTMGFYNITPFCVMLCLHVGLYPDNRYEILIDEYLVTKGSLLEDVDPPLNPPQEVADPHDTKPADWDDRPHIPDPMATKPMDW